MCSQTFNMNGQCRSTLARMKEGMPHTLELYSIVATSPTNMPYTCTIQKLTANTTSLTPAITVAQADNITLCEDYSIVSRECPAIHIDT